MRLTRYHSEVLAHGSLFVIVLITGTIAGFFFAFSVDVNLATATLDAHDYILIQQAINAKVRNLVFGGVYFSCLLLPPLVWLAYRRDRARRGWLAAGFLIYFIGVFLVTQFINVPINVAMAQWSPQQPPAAWETTRARWNDANVVRTIACLLAFACYLRAISLKRRAP